MIPIENSHLISLDTATPQKLYISPTGIEQRTIPPATVIDKESGRQSYYELFEINDPNTHTSRRHVFVQDTYARMDLMTMSTPLDGFTDVSLNWILTYTSSKGRVDYTGVQADAIPLGHDRSYYTPRYMISTPRNLYTLSLQGSRRGSYIEIMSLKGATPESLQWSMHDPEKLNTPFPLDDLTGVYLTDDYEATKLYIVNGQALYPQCLTISRRASLEGNPLVGEDYPAYPARINGPAIIKKTGIHFSHERAPDFMKG